MLQRSEGEAMRYFYWEWGFKVPFGRAFYAWAEPSDHLHLGGEFELGLLTGSITLHLALVTIGFGVAQQVVIK